MMLMKGFRVPQAHANAAIAPTAASPPAVWRQSCVRQKQFLLDGTWHVRDPFFQVSLLPPTHFGVEDHLFGF